jgi:phosphatidylglycerophosphate synthase
MIRDAEMERPSEHTVPPASRVTRSRSAWWADFAGRALAWRKDLFLGLVVVSGVSVPVGLFTDVAATYVATAILLFLSLALIVVHATPPVFRTEGPGPANRVTFLRAALVVPVAALVFHPSQQDVAAIHGLLAVAVLALLLDAVDGAVARRSGRVTAFGARFDMELDALLILVLAILVWQTEKAGVWVLLIGLMRYGFVAAGWYWRWLQGALPPSRRRQALCVVQSGALMFALSPLVPLAAAVPAVLGALALLVYSFALDVLWLFRHRNPPVAAE